MSAPSDVKPKQSDLGPKKTLTPQRKHRKLLKDGSGEEVWPESVEKIFVQGLREYWQSPWATFTQSRGRSRWRNQFLVDYLQKYCISRTKKQVASHIQVLRNMWKGEPEFYLVAGGEELFLDTGVLGLVKVEDGYDMPLDCDEHDTPSSNSASPDVSPRDHPSADFSSPTATLASDSDNTSTLLQQDDWSTHKDATPRAVLSVFSFNATTRPVDSQERQSSFPSAESPLDSSSPLAFSGPAVPPPRGPYKPVIQQPVVSNQSRSADASFPPTSGINGVKTVCLLADGMTPFSIHVDALLASQSRGAWLALKLKLYITSVDDIRSPATLHGFAGSICLSGAWANPGKCITKVYVGNSCISEEVGALVLSNIEVGRVTVILPDSSLARCRWLDASIPTRLTQEIKVDEQTLVYLIYDLDRRNGMPSAELMGYQTCKSAETTPASPQPNFSTIYSCLPSPQSLPFYRQSLPFH
ncbi:hypothetical protein L208DRAFT_1292868 [Tricholoma matsutake]|nr:hypothetical protein L208DRAFT_1292868 [Tricholoma matsutake 945]